MLKSDIRSILAQVQIDDRIVKHLGHGVQFFTRFEIHFLIGPIILKLSTGDTL